MKFRGDTYNWLLKVLLASIVLSLIFAVVWVRSSYFSLEYKIYSLEKKKTELIKSRKLLTAQRANLISAQRFGNFIAGGFTYPDRIKVTYVKGYKKEDLHKVSYKGQ
jgi:hypothetical protein